jgi:hypothetical protein
MRPTHTLLATALTVLYRFLGSHLVLLDTRANVILDRIPCAIECTH